MNSISIYTTTRKGNPFNLFSPNPKAINIYDIAAGLAYNSHFAGQTPHFFSIAQHSIMVHNEYVSHHPDAPREMRLLALMHDAAEAYIGDIIRPIKQFLPMFIGLEKNLLIAIGQKFKMPVDRMSEIKTYDDHIIRIEYNYFYNNGKEIEYMGPEHAMKNFLNIFFSITGNGCKYK